MPLPEYIVRVELHGEQPKDYPTLHLEMIRAGFSKTITLSDGKLYDLPKAEYHICKSLTIAQVFAKADIAARKTGRDSSILVTKIAELLAKLAPSKKVQTATARIAELLRRDR